MENNTLLLIRMGCDVEPSEVNPKAPDAENYRLRWIYRNICCDFMLTSKTHYTTKNGNLRKYQGAKYKEHQNLYLTMDADISAGDITMTFDMLPNKWMSERLEHDDRGIIYSYLNILEIVNQFTGRQYNKVKIVYDEYEANPKCTYDGNYFIASLVLEGSDTPAFERPFISFEEMRNSFDYAEYDDFHYQIFVYEVVMENGIEKSKKKIGRLVKEELRMFGDLGKFKMEYDEE